MNTDPPPDGPPPESLNVPLAALVGLGIEHWRLATWLAARPTSSAAAAAAASTAQARHAVRRIEDFLKQCDLEVRALDGRPFDAGLAARVVHTEDDPTLPEGHAVITETVSPLVLWRGRVIKPAEVVTRRGTG